MVTGVLPVDQMVFAQALPMPTRYSIYIKFWIGVDFRVFDVMLGVSGAVKVGCHFTVVFVPPVVVAGIQILGLRSYFPGVVDGNDAAFFLRDFGVSFSKTFPTTEDGEDWGFFVGS